MAAAQDPGLVPQHLDDLRRGLLRVHKALLEDARIRYEREQGRIDALREPERRRPFA